MNQRNECKYYEGCSAPICPNLSDAQNFDILKVPYRVTSSERGLDSDTQLDFAEAIGERPSLVLNFIRGGRKLPDWKQLIWATTLACTVSEIFSD
jgi:hypothetical protein